MMTEQELEKRNSELFSGIPLTVSEQAAFPNMAYSADKGLLTEQELADRNAQLFSSIPLDEGWIDKLPERKLDAYYKTQQQLGYLSPDDEGVWQLWKGAKRGVVSGARGFLSTANELGIGDGDWLRSIDEYISRNQDYMSKPEGMDAFSSVGGLSDTLGHGLASTAMLVPASIAGGAAGTAVAPGAGTIAGAVGGAAGTAIGMFAQTYGENLNALRELNKDKRYTDDELKGLAATQSLTDGLIEGAFGMVPIGGKIAKTGISRAFRQAIPEVGKKFGKQAAIKTFGTIGKAGFKGALEEGGEEFLQSLVDQTIQNLVKNGEASVDLYEAWKAGLEGVPGGFVLGTAGGIQNAQSRSAKMKAITAIRSNPEAREILAEATRQTKENPNDKTIMQDAYKKINDVLAKAQDVDTETSSNAVSERSIDDYGIDKKVKKNYEPSEVQTVPLELTSEIRDAVGEGAHATTEDVLIMNPKSRLAKLLSDFTSEATGQETVYYVPKNASADSLNGMVGKDGKVYINVNKLSDHPLVTTGHEIGHVIERTAKDIWQTFSDVVLKDMGEENIKKYSEKLGENPSPREITSAVLGDMFADPKTMRKVLERGEARNAGFAKKFVDVMNKFITFVKAKIRGGTGVTEYLNHLEKVRDAAADMMVDYKKRQGDEKSAGETPHSKKHKPYNMETAIPTKHGFTVDRVNDKAGEQFNKTEGIVAKPDALYKREEVPAHGFDGFVRKKAIEYEKTHGGIQGDHYTPALESNVSVTGKSFRNIAGHEGGDIKFNLIPYIPQMLKNAVHVQSEGNGTHKSHILASKIRYGTQRLIASMVIRENHGKRYYDHSLTEIKNAERLAATVKAPPAPQRSASVSNVTQHALMSSGLDKNDSKNTEFSRKYRQKNPIEESNTEVRKAYDKKLDEYTPEHKTIKGIQSEAEAYIQKNGGYQEVLKSIADGDIDIGANSKMVAVGLKALNSHEFKAMLESDPDAATDIGKKFRAAIGKSMESRSELGRSMRMLQEIAKLNDPTGFGAMVNSELSGLSKEQRNRLIDSIKKQFGIDLDNITKDAFPDGKNPKEDAKRLSKLAEIVREIQSKNSKWHDKMYEFWINSILSAPTTHIANILGNSVNMGIELLPQRFIEAMINTVARRKDAATFRDFRTMWNALNMKEAWKRAKRAWDLEVFDREGKLERQTTAIGGIAGRVVRSPGRFLKAADELAKGMIVPMEAAVHAERAGRAQGLKGKSLENYIKSQLSDSASAANLYGHNRALELTYQQDIDDGFAGGVVKALMQMRESGGLGGWFAKFALPFMKTPYNLLKEGIRKSPAGSLGFLKENIDVMRGKRSIDDAYIKHAAEQILAWGTTMAMLSNYDDKDPWITGTSANYGTGEANFKGEKLPPFSIKLGGRWYSYKRIEPISTGLAMIADGLKGYSEAKNGKDMTQVIKDITGNTMQQLVTEKTFLDGIGQIVKAFEEPERYGANLASNFISSWVPNAVRATLNAMDNKVHDFKSREKGLEFWNEQFKYTVARTGFIDAEPKLDYFGREITKTEPLAPFLWRLMIPSVTKPADNMNRAEKVIWEYNKNNPDEPYYPNVFSPTTTRQGVKYYLAGEGYTEYAKAAGKKFMDGVEKAISQGRINTKNPSAGDIELIKKIRSKAVSEGWDTAIQKRKAKKY